MKYALKDFVKKFDTSLTKQRKKSVHKLFSGINIIMISALKNHTPLNIKYHVDCSRYSSDKKRRSFIIFWTGSSLSDITSTQFGY